MFDRCIVFAGDADPPASFPARRFARAEPIALGQFVSATRDDGVALLFAAPGIGAPAQHDAPRVSEDAFDAISGRIAEAGEGRRADPRGEQPGTCNRTDGGRGVCFRDPAGHGLEILTRPDGSAG